MFKQFPICSPILDFVIKRVKINARLHLNDLGRTQVPKVICKFQGCRYIGSGGEDSIHGNSGHFGHATQVTYFNFHSYSLISFHMKFGFS